MLVRVKPVRFHANPCAPPSFAGNLNRKAGRQWGFFALQVETPAPPDTLLPESPDPIHCFLPWPPRRWRKPRPSISIRVHWRLFAVTFLFFSRKSTLATFQAGFWSRIPRPPQESLKRLSSISPQSGHGECAGSTVVFSGATKPSARLRARRSFPGPGCSRAGRRFRGCP